MDEKTLSWDEVIQEIADYLAEVDEETLIELYKQCFPWEIKYDGDSSFTVTGAK